jgi:hypothetical protein
MATSTLIQKLDAVTDPLVSGTVGSTSDTMHRRQVETFIAAETLLVGDWVGFDLDRTNDADVTLFVVKADTSPGASLASGAPIGVVLGADSTTGLLTSGSRVKVCISGVCDALTSDAAGAGMAIGALLVPTGTAGQADLAPSPLTRPVCGLLAETIPAASGSGLRRVFVVNSF